MINTISQARRTDGNEDKPKIKLRTQTPKAQERLEWKRKDNFRVGKDIKWGK